MPKASGIPFLLTSNFTIMKRNFLNLLTLMVLVFASKSCDKDDTKTEVQITSADIEAIKATAMSGEWIITYYFDTDKDETSDYDGYTFKFNTNGTLGATNGNSSLSGAWSISSSDNSSNDDSSDEVDFNIFFSSPDVFEELSDDWDIKKYSDTKIELIDISGGNGGTDLLTFEKK